jgi:exo-beta-1,3-glucanase (GH17 family)
MKKQLALFTVTIMVLMSCNQNTKQDATSIREMPEDIQPTQQLFANTHEAVCYSGFRTGQHPDRGEGAVNPSAEETLEDLNLLKEHLGTSLIRLYDCGENSQLVLETIKDNNLNIKVLLGVWLKAELSAHETCSWLAEPIPDSILKYNKAVNLMEISKGIELANQYQDIIVGINVGNEALVEWNDHKVDTDTIISYVQGIQANIVQPVTVADNYLWWAENGSNLAEVVDFVSVHIYPVWEGKNIEEAMSYTLQNFQQVRDSLPNSNIVITEAGWASIASEFGDRASEEHQKRYYQEIMAWSEANNITTFFFEAFDEDWKGNPDNMMGAEKHWGLFNVDRTPKQVVNAMSIAE